MVVVIAHIDGRFVQLLETQTRRSGKYWHCLDTQTRKHCEVRANDKMEVISINGDRLSSRFECEKQ